MPSTKNNKKAGACGESFDVFGGARCRAPRVRRTQNGEEEGHELHEARLQGPRVGPPRRLLRLHPGRHPRRHEDRAPTKVRVPPRVVLSAAGREKEKHFAKLRAPRAASGISSPSPKRAGRAAPPPRPAAYRERLSPRQRRASENCVAGHGRRKTSCTSVLKKDSNDAAAQMGSGHCAPWVGRPGSDPWERAPRGRRTMCGVKIGPRRNFLAQDSVGQH